jgi:hypothetical protein
MLASGRQASNPPDVVRNPGMVSFVIDIGDPAVLQIGSIIWIVRDSRRTREELVSIGHIAEDNAMEASNAADSFIRNHAEVSDHVQECHHRCPDLSK